MYTPDSSFSTGKAVKIEINELHQFFQNWFQGTIDSDIQRLRSVLDEDFTLITPSGVKLNRQEIIEGIEKEYGLHSNKKIWIENITTKYTKRHIIATYYEVQKNKDETTKRISTAVFSFDPNLENYSKWLHVHETWQN